MLRKVFYVTRVSFGRGTRVGQKAGISATGSRREKAPAEKKARQREEPG